MVEESVQATADEYISVPLSSLQIDTVPDFDLYMITAAGTTPVLYRGRNLPFTTDARERLSEHNVSELYISPEQRNVYYQYAESNLEHVLKDASLSSEKKTQLLYVCAHRAVEHIMSEPEAPDVMPRSTALVENMLKFMAREQSYFSMFMDVTSESYHIYTHSVNVFVYATTLARRIYQYDHTFMRDFGAATLLHDIGKSRVNDEINECPGALSDEQWNVMRQHSSWSEEILRGHGTTNPIILNVARHHHEKLTGAGYPDGLKGDDIKPYVRMVTICDIFDALTTNRTHKNAIGSFPALKLMQQEMKDDLDPEYFRAFVEMMAPAKEF
jgi:putative nucleotidyltransferase with HDIG domain